MSAETAAWLVLLLTLPTACLNILPPVGIIILVLVFRRQINAWLAALNERLES